MKRITCLMLDMGGVLTQPHRLEKVDELMRALGLTCAREAFLKTYFAERSDYDRGTADAAEYWRRVAGALGARFSEPEVPNLVRIDLESWFNKREGMLDLVGGLRGRVGRLVLLSNLHYDGARYLREGEGRDWASPFDELVISCEHKLLKPERGIYELALAAAEALPAEALFVDDSPENVEGARAVGLSSFVFAGEDDFRSRLAAEYELSR
jgi:putative hydrolase of the HAD superfamily